MLNYAFVQAMYGEKCVGAIVCKLDLHKKVVRRGYIAMLAVDENYRQEKIGIILINRSSLLEDVRLVVPYKYQACVFKEIERTIITVLFRF